MDNNKYLNTVNKLNQQGKDKIGKVGKLFSTTIGATAGGLLSPYIASTAGAKTLLGSTWLANLLGGVFVTTTPIGWVMGGIVGGASIGYLIAKLISSGTKSDCKKEELIEKLKQAAEAQRQKENLIKITPNKLMELEKLLLSANNSANITSGQINDILNATKEGKIDIDELIEMLHQ